MHLASRCPLGCGPELPLQLSRFCNRLIADGVLRSGLAGQSLTLTRYLSMTTAGTLPSSRVVPHGLRGSGPGHRGRSPEAEEAWEQALQELAAGHTVSATALLRRAMALAPGDPEIARKFGEVAFGER